MRWRVSLQDYSITVYTTGVLASKAVHLHHHYASEEFGLLDFIFSPTFFLYDIVAWSTVYLLLFGYENLKSTRLSGSLLVTDLKHNAPPLNDSSYNTLSATDAYPQTAGNVHVAPSESAKSGPRFARFLGYCLVLITTYFSVADAFVYLNFGGLCSWPTVIEVTFSPGSVYTFMTQWVSIGEFFTIIVTPELTCAAFYVLTVIWQNFPLELLSTYQRVRAFDASIFALTLALKISSVIPQPAAGMLLLIASISMLFKLVARLQTHVQSDGQSNSLSPDSDTRRDSNTKSRAHDANSPRGNSIKLTIALVFAGMSLFRPPAFHDVSVTAPLSLCLAVLGFTPEQCPVGKSWPTLPHQPTPYFLGCESNGCSQSQIDLAFASSDIAGYLPTTQSIEGFEMISPERTSQWKNWTRARSGVAPQGYNSMFDLSKVSNHNAALLQELSVPGSADRVGLRQLKVNHIIFFVMESTSWEMFPLRRRGRIYQKIMKSRIPGKHYASMDNLAPTARRLFTGETSNNTSGISDGGIVVEGAQTAISYTLKSLIASHCGVSPLAMDFTREAAGDAHLYQPCLAHVLKALNHIGSSGENSAYGETIKEMWKVLYSQSTHARFDRQISLMHKMGFDKAGEMLNKHEMDDPEAPYPVPQSEKDLPTGFFFYPEEYLTPYFRDFWTNGRDHQQRTFVSHLTTTTHCPWELPETWSFQEYGEDEKLNRMLNAFEYQDQWLKQLLDMLIGLGIYNETLVVLSGDHGSAYSEGDLELSLPFNNPHIANFQIPLMFHHPMLPRAVVQSNISIDSILPTVLDIMASSKSLSNDRQREFLAKLIPRYEGQSLIRPLQYTIDYSDVHTTADTAVVKDNKHSMQSMSFGLLNPGRSHVVVISQDPAIPWRLSMPLCHHGRFTAMNHDEDPGEDFPVRAVTRARLLKKVEARWGSDAAMWVDTAHDRAAEWVLEVSRRWGIDQRSPPGEMVTRFEGKVKPSFGAKQLH